MEKRRASAMRSSSRALIVVALAFGAALSGCAAERPGIRGTAYAPAGSFVVYVYEKDADPHGPARIIHAAPASPDGRFVLDLPPGEYTLVARLRTDRENSGPMMAGDLRSEPVKVRIREGERLPLDLLMNVKEDVEVKSWTPPKEWRTAISGTIRDEDGRPVEGARVLAYRNAQLSERPQEVSDLTGPDGRYVLFLPKGGSYHLAARNRFGGPPRLGDLFGRYDDGAGEPSGVILRDGETREKADITVRKIW